MSAKSFFRQLMTRSVRRPQQGTIRKTARTRLNVERIEDRINPIVINDAVGPAGALALGNNHPAVVTISTGGTGILIDSTHVITAQHVTFGAGSVTVGFHHVNNDGVADATRTSSAINEIDGTNSLLDGTDVSIITLSSPAPAGIVPLRLSSSNPALGSLIRTVGYGFQGVGSTGHAFTSSGTRWAGDNILDAIGAGRNPGGVAIPGSANIFNTDFDNNTAGANTLSPGVTSSQVPVPNEATTAPGDSGGPLLVNNEIVAVLSGGTTATSPFGDISWWTGTLTHQNFIRTNTTLPFFGNTITLPEDGNANTLRVVRNGANLEFHFDPDGPGAAPATLVNVQPMADFGTINVQGTSQNDTLVMDLSGGQIVPTINFTAGGGTDTQTYDYSGGFNFAPSTVSSLEVFNLIGTGGNDAIGLLSSSPTSQTITFPGTSFGFSTLTAINIFGGGGTDTLTVDYAGGTIPIPITYDGGTGAGDALVVQGGSFASGVYTPSSPTNGTITHVGGATGTAGLITFLNLSPVTDTTAMANFTINGTAGVDTVNVVNGPVAGQVQVNSGAVPTFELVNFANKTNVLVDLSQGGADSAVVNFNANATGLTNLTIQGGSATDSLSAQATPAAVTTTILGGAGLDFINVGNTGAITAPGNLTNVAGPVVVNGEVGGANLVVDGSGAGVTANYTVTNNTVTRSLPVGFGGVTYTGVTTVLLTVGGGANIIDVVSTSVPTTITTNGGVDTINLGATTNTLAGLAGAVSVNGGGQAGDTLNLLDSSAVAGQSYVVNANTITRTGVPAINYTGVTVLNLTATTLNDTITVATVGAGVTTTINSGAGDDTITTAGGAPVAHVAEFSNGTSTPGLDGLTATGLWHATNAGNVSLLPSHSGPEVAYYGQDATGNYDTGATNNGTLTTGAITLAAGASLSFNYRLQTEGSTTFDAASVQISTNGGATFTNLRSTTNSTLPFSATWTTLNVDLSAFAGQTVLIRFSFDTVDSISNNFLGWQVDDISVRGVTGAAASPLVINAGAGDDTINLGMPPAGPVTIDGGPHNTGDTLNIDAAGTGVTITPTSITIGGVSLLFTSITNIENFNILNAGPVTATGTAANDTLTITTVNPPAAPTSSARIGFTAPGSPAITLSGITVVNYTAGAGDDTLVVDYSGGASSFPINYDATAGGTNEVLTLQNGTYTTVTHNLDTPNAGNVQFGPTGGTITYVNLTPIFDNLNAVNRVFNFGAGNDNDVLLHDPNGISNSVVLSSPLNAETVTFNTLGLASVTVNLGTGTDAMRIRALEPSFVATINVNGDADDDRLTVDYSDGVVTEAINFDGGTGTNTLEFNSNNAIPGNPFTAAARESYYATGDNKGTYTVDPDGSAGPGGPVALLGADAVSVNFLNTQNIESALVVNTLDIIMNHAAASSDIGTLQNFAPGTLPTPNGAKNALQYADNSNTFSHVFFTQHTNIRIHGSLGADAVRLNATTNAEGLVNVEAYGHIAPGFPPAIPLPADDNSNDEFDLHATIWATSKLFGQGGSDLFENSNFGVLHPTSTFDLSQLTGDITITGGETAADVDVVVLQDPNAAGPDLVTLTATQLLGAAPATFTYSEAERFFFESTDGNDTINVISTAAGTSYLVTGDGGNDTITVGNQTADFNTTFDGSLNAILGDITFSGEFNNSPPTGTDTINVDDSGTNALADLPTAATIGTVAAFNYDFGPYFAGFTGAATVMTNFTGTTLANTVPIRYYHAAFGFVGTNAVENLNILTSTGNDIVNVNATTATVATTMNTREGNDLVNIQGNALQPAAAHTFSGFTGNDKFNINLAAGTSVPAVAGTTLVINGDAPASDPANRDVVNINANQAADGPRIVGVTFLGGGDANVTGLGTASFIDLNTVETVQYNGDAANNDTLTVTGTAGNDVISVTPYSPSAAAVFLNGTPTTSPPGAPADNDPGVANATPGPDLFLFGMSPGTGTGLTIDGAGGDNRLVVNGTTEAVNGADQGAAWNAAAFGGVGSVVLPAGKAFDTINVTDTLVDISNAFLGGSLVRVNYNKASFAGSAKQDVVVNTGEELIGAVTVADDISVTLSATLGFQINGGQPLPPAGAPLRGDRLNVVTPTELNIFSDAMDPPNVSITSSIGGVPTQPLTFNNIEILVLTSGNGQVNIIGDNNSGVAQNDAIVVLGQDVDSTLAGGDLFGNNEFQLLIGGDNTQSLLNRAPIAVRNALALNITSKLGDDDIVIDPFANSTTPWNVVVNVDSGAGDDDVGYGNIIRNVFADNAPDGSQALVNENVTLTAALAVGAGTIASPGVVTITFQNTEDVSFLLNDGTLGDTDELTIRTPDSALSDAVTVRPDAAGDDAAPVVDIDTNGVQLLQVENIANVAPGGAQFFVTAINFELRGGNDVIDVAPGASGTQINVDGGNPTGTSGDTLIVTGTANVDDAFSLTPGGATNKGTLVQSVGGVARAPVNFANIESIQLSGGGGTGSDTLTLNGTPGDDAFAVTGTAGAAAGTAAVSGQPVVAFSAFGSGANTAIVMNGLGGDDLFTVNHAAGWLIPNVTANGGLPTASDTLNIVGTAAVDAFVFTPGSGKTEVTTGGGTTNYNQTGIEIYNLDGGDPTTVPGDTLVVNSFMTGLATVPNGTLGAIPRLVNYQNFESVLVNESPTAIDDPNAVTNEDTPVVIDVIANDMMIADSPLFITITTQPANGTAVVLNNGTATPTVRYTPNLNFNGVDTFQYTLQDANGEPLTPIPATVTITVNAVNDAPVNTAPATLTAQEDVTTPVPGLAVSDVDFGAAELITVTLTATNGTLDGIGFGGGGTATITITDTLANVNAALLTVAYTSDANYNGPATITMVADDNGNVGLGGPLTDTDVINVTVTPVNDTPVNTLPVGPVVVDEDVPTVIAGVSVFDIDSLDLGVGAFDVRVALSVTNGTLSITPAVGLSITNNGTAAVTIEGTLAAVNAALATLTYTSNANYNGPDTLTVTANDLGNRGTGGPLTDTDTVAIDVTAVNDSPVNTVPGTLTAVEDTITAVTGLSVADVDAAAGTVTVTLTATNGTLDGVGFGGGGTTTITITDTVANVNAALATVTFTGDLNYNGPATITMVTDDNGNTGTGGPLSDTDVIAVLVTAVNDAPVNTVPGPVVVDEDVPTVIAGISVADIDSGDTGAGAFDVRVTLTVLNGTLSVVPGGGLNVNGNGTAAVTIEGTIFDVNAALAGLTYTSNLNFNGADTLTVVTNDLGNLGTGGPLEDVDTVDITVTAVNDAPTFDLPNPTVTVNEDAGAQTIAGFLTNISVGPADEAAQTIIAVTVTQTGGAAGLFAAAPTIDTTGTLTFTPTPNASGTATFTVTIQDDGGGTDTSITRTFTIVVTAVADAPMVTVVSPANGTEGAPIALTITADLVDTDGSETLSLISISGFPIGTTFSAGINDNTTVILTVAELAGLTMTVPDGGAAFTLQVSVSSVEGSNGSTATSTATIDVTVTNVVPTGTFTNNGPVNEGSTGTVSVTNQADPSQSDIVAGFHYAFDFDNNGIFEVGDGTYAGSPDTASVTVPASFLDDGPDTQTVRVRILDKDGGFTEELTTVTIDNVAPTASFTPSGAFIERQPITLTFSKQADPSTADTNAGFTYSFDLDNDGVFEIANSTNPTATFTPPVQGTYTLRGRITDKDGGSTDYVATTGTAAGVVIANVDRYAVGPGVGGAPRVNIYSTDGTLLASIFAQDPDFRGGLQVAMGDLTGDGIPDLVTGTGVGGGPVVQAYDGATFQLITSFFAYEGTFRGGVQVAVGDVDGDGRAEIITGVGDGGGPVVKVFNLNTTLRASFFAYEGTFRGGVNVAAGDVDGDGDDDIITGAGNGGGPVAKVFNGQTLTLVRSILAYEETFRGGVNVSGGDIDGDGRFEVVTGTGFTGGPRMRSFDALTGAPELSVFAFGPDRITQEPLRNGFRVTTVDIDGDGIEDILAASGKNFAPIINVYFSIPPAGPKLVEFFLPFEPEFTGGVYIG